MRGLDNLGNTCWANAALQCLVHCPQLARFFLTDTLNGRATQAFQRGEQHRLAAALADFVRIYWRGEPGTRVPTSALRNVVDLLTAPGEQGMPQDAHETFSGALEALHRGLQQPFESVPEAPSRSRVDLEQWERYCSAPANQFSVLVEIFVGQQIVACPGEDDIYEHFWQLRIPSDTSAEDGLASLLNATEERGDGKTVRRRTTYLPVCLVIAGSGMRVDPTLDAGDLGRYEAVAAAAHVGTHWIAACKESSDWCLCDDTELKRIPANDIMVLSGVQFTVYRRM
jgi:hypothetical protein